MINKEEILKHIISLGKTTSLEEIEELINQQDRESIAQTQKDRFKYEIWDKKSNINGVTAKQIIKSRNYEIDKAYMIYIDEVLVYFQDHNPNESGYVKMTKTQASKIAEDFINQKIEENTDNIIVDKVIETILSKE